MTPMTQNCKAIRGICSSTTEPTRSRSSQTMGDSLDSSKEKSKAETPETMGFHTFSHQKSWIFLGTRVFWSIFPVLQELCGFPWRHEVIKSFLGSGKGHFEALLKAWQAQIEKARPSAGKGISWHLLFSFFSRYPLVMTNIAVE